MMKKYRRKKIIIVLAIVLFCVVIILIYFNKKESERKDAELYQDPDIDFFGEELMKELDHKASAEEKAVADQVLAYASEVAAGKVKDDSIVYSCYSPYTEVDCKTSKLSIKMLTCIINGEEGHLWVEYSHNMYDSEGNLLKSSGVPRSLWYLKKENETWKVTSIREHP